MLTIKGPMDSNGNSRKFTIRCAEWRLEEMKGEVINVSAPEYRRLARLLGVGLNDEDATAEDKEATEWARRLTGR